MDKAAKTEYLLSFIEQFRPKKRGRTYEYYKCDATLIAVAAFKLNLLEELVEYIERDKPKDLDTVTDWIDIRLNDIWGDPEEDDD